MSDICARLGAAWGRLAVLLVVALTLAVAATSGAQAQSSVRPPSNAAQDMPTGGEVPGNSLGSTSDAEIWREIRHGGRGNVTIPDEFAATLIQSQGQDWRLLRTEYIISYSTMLILAVVTILMIFFAIRGRIRIEGGRSGRVMTRFSLTERVVHWVIAGLFILLAVSGLVMLLGREYVIPVIGPEAFSVIARASLQVHNVLGPLFVISIFVLFFTFIRGNSYRLVDLVWAIKAGGLLGGHASSGRYNFGQKSWFWLVIVAGLVISVTGLLMLFPVFSAGNVAPLVTETMAGLQFLQWANVIHTVSAVVLIGVSIGHIYLGTIGMEGALESMTRGTVDENWAKEHHDLWYAQHKGKPTEDVSAEAKAAHGKA